MSKRLDDALVAYSRDGNSQRFLEACAAIAAGELGHDRAPLDTGDEAADFERWLESYRASQRPRKIGQLLKRGEAGIEEALTLLDQHYRFGVCGQLREMYPDLASQDLADIWQDVLLAIYRKALQGTLDFERGVDGMIWGIAELRAQDLIRTRRRRPRGSFAVVATSVGRPELGRRWQMLTGLQKEEVKDLIWTSMDRLPVNHKAIWQGYLQYLNDHSRPPTTEQLCQLVPLAAAELEGDATLESVLEAGRKETTDSLVRNGYDIFSAIQGEVGWGEVDEGEVDKGEVDKGEVDEGEVDEGDDQDVFHPVDRFVAEAFHDRRSKRYPVVPDFGLAETLLHNEDRDALENLPSDLVSRVRSKYGALRMWSSPLWSHGKPADTYLSTATVLETRTPVRQTMEELVAAYQTIVEEKRIDWAPRCQFVALLGEGGQGVVYLVKRSGFDGFSNPLALKIFAPDRHTSPRTYLADARRMARTAGIVAQIHHPNVLDVQDFEEQNGVLMMLMEWVDGYDLERLTAQAMLKRLKERTSTEELDHLNEVVVRNGPDHPRLRPFIAVDIIRSCLAALRRMHEEGIVHGDIKPSNIMLTRDGYVKLIDIGSAFVWHESPAPYHCTYRYAAPEVVEHGVYTPQSDLASLGYVLVELLSGQALFANIRSRRELHEAKVSLPGRLPELLPERARRETMLLELCRRLVEPDPTRRFAGAGDADLDERCGTLALQNRIIKANLGTSPAYDISHWLRTLG